MSLLLLRALRANRPLWQNTVCGKKVVQSRKWECTMPVDEMFDILPQDAAWGHEMAHDADGLEMHYVRRG